MGDWIGAAPNLWGKRSARAPGVSPGTTTSAPSDGARSGIVSRAPFLANGPNANGTHREEGDAEEAEPYSDDPVRNRQKELQDLIVEAESAERILAAVRELDGAIVISTALHRLGKVGVPGQTQRDPRFAVLLEKLRARLPFFGSRQIANSLHGMGALVYRDGGPWVPMVSVQTQRRIRDFEPQHVSNTLWACAKMQLQEPLMLRVLVDRAIDDIARSCPLDVSIVTWACATLKYHEVEWLRAVVRARLDFADFSPQNMSNFVWGLATLKFRNDNMVLAVGREAARKIQDFIPQELSNFCWALATMDLCDNLWLRAVAEEVDRRAAAGELHTWDPQSLSNMMWAYATLAVKDDFLFKHLLDASVARIEDHDSQNLANTSWAAAMVIFRSARWLEAAAAAVVRGISGSEPLHLAQLAFAFSRFLHTGEKVGFVPALRKETLERADDFPPQSLLDVQDALIFFNSQARSPNQIERRIDTFLDSLFSRMEAFAALCARSKPSADQAAAYRRDIEQRDIVSLGSHYTSAFLRRFGLLCSDTDPFVADGRSQIKAWRDREGAKDPTSRSIFHRAQCAWQLGMHGDDTGALADGIFESGEPTDGGPSKHNLVVCRLRHPREGDAEIQALCAAMNTSIFKRGQLPRGLVLNLHLSDVPCVSCLGATLQFHFRHPGVLRVSFDRGREVPEDTIPVPRPPPPPSRKGNAFPYAPVPEFYAKSTGGATVDDNGEIVDRSLVRREGPDCRETTTFYNSGNRAPRRADGAASGGVEAVPHKVRSNPQGGQHQTFYFSSRPEFHNSSEYDSC